MGGEFPIPCTEELSMLLRVFGWFITHYMGNMVPETEEQGGIGPLEETVGDGDIRLGLTCSF